MSGLPDAALDDRIGVVGTAGSGKTYGAGTAVERILARKGRVIIPDPLGVWWGLRLTADGKTASPYNVVIFGGEHGDLPLTEYAGALIGETVAGMQESAILDLSGLGTKAAERRFMLAFLTALYRKASGEPVHLIFDEADMWAPQKLLDKDGEAAKLLGMMETICRRGRVKGFIPWLITQRPAVLSKDVLSQVDGLVAFKLTSSQDRAALGGWIDGQADQQQGKAILAALPTKERGQAIIWLPARGVLADRAFPQKATFDSSRTPKRGEVQPAAVLKPLDLSALKERLGKVEAEAKANDPKTLKAEIAMLRKQLSAAPAKPVELPPDPKQIEAAEVRGFNAGVEATRQALAPKAHALSAALAELLAVSVLFQKPVAVRPAPRTNGAAPPPRAMPVRDAMAEPAVETPTTRKVIDEIHRAYPVALSFEAAALRAGVSRRSSQYRLYRNQVEQSVEVTRRDDGKFQSAPGYAKDVGPGINPVDEFAAKLPPSYAAMLRAIASSGVALSKDEVAERAGVSPKSSGLIAGLRELSALGLIETADGAYQLHSDIA